MEKKGGTAVEPQGARLHMNPDTNFLKLVAAAAMLVDHVGALLFPGLPALRWIGRVSFPLFCYCMAVGLCRTRNFPRYLGRMGVFALLSQPCWALALYPRDPWENLWSSLNIFFTLFFTLLSARGWLCRRWEWALAGLAALLVLPCDYHAWGLLLVLLFLLCRQRPALGAAAYTLIYLLSALVGRQPGENFTFPLAGRAVGYEIFALAALPLLLLPGRLHPKVGKWFFYGFYPLHLLAIGFIRLALDI